NSMKFQATVPLISRSVIAFFTQFAGTLCMCAKGTFGMIGQESTIYSLCLPKSTPIIFNQYSANAWNAGANRLRRSENA
ncbi:hypothetical protein D7Y09_14555, partial [bacterium 1XD42-1]